MFPVRRTLASSLVAVLVALAAVIASDVAVPAPAQAADPSAFRPGSLISDSLFFDGGAMTAADVQSFLNSKGAACTAGGLCLKNYVTSSSSQPAEAGLCAAYTGAGAETAAQIIARVGAACGVSQKALLVTLQKEQGLVTTTSPTESRYRTAMGFGCPDTAPCDAQYYGFFNQVYRAARQFKRYAASPQSYSYRAGRTNNVLFHPNGACGSSPVYIENQATAGLYTYTPYQPNAAALGNLYGTGDGCSAYGNRNFWRDYTDWFGSTQVGANLVRTAADPTVYLVTFDRKYPVADLAVLDSLSPLGAVGVVQQSFLDSKATGVTMGRFLRDQGGTIWFVDRGQLFSVTDCAQLAEWGGRCADYVSMTLSDVQMAGFSRAGQLTYAAITPEGKRFAVYGGQKHEIADPASSYLHPAAGTPVRPIAESSLSYLPYGDPLVRPGILVRDRSTGEDRLVDVERSLVVARGLVGETRLRALGVHGLDHASVARMPAPAGTLDGLVKGRDGTVYALSAQSLVRLTPDQLSQLAPSAQTLSDGVVAAMGPAWSGTVFVRSVESGALFVAVNDVKRPVATMDIAAAVAGPGGPVVTFVAQSALDRVPEWAPALPPARLIKAQGQSQIYLTDGAGTLHAVTSFAITDAMGAGGWSEVNVGYVNVSRIAAKPLSAAVACGSLRYVGSGGRLVPVDPGTLDASGTPTSTLDPATCAALPRAAATAVGTPLVKGPDTPSLFVATGGLKRPVTSMSTAFALAAPGELLVVPVPQAALDAMPTHVDMLAPGTLVKASDSPDIHLVDGTSTLVRLPTFEIASSLGLNGWTTVPPAVVAAHSVASTPLGTAVSCGSQRYVGSGGRLVSVDRGTFDAAGVPATPLTVTTCANLPRGGSSAGPVFLRTASDPTLYLAQSGTKRPVATMAQVYWLTGGQNPLVALVTESVLAGVPTGPAV